ncbi:MAG TPA: ATP-dependent Clp protease proteolytic subunit [Planctomycetaceae bacterium]|nr:ATP-dependent Clp protease proteolytic subunit [Planctomycetaceae bacterium]
MTRQKKQQHAADESLCGMPYPPPGAWSASKRPKQTDWEIGIFGDLTDKQTELFQQLMDVPRNSHGTIFFDSGGGSIYCGLALATVIKLRGLRAIGVVAGECSSATILPFAACEERYVTPHSTLLFHPIRWQSDEEVRLEEAAEWTRHFKLLEEDMDKLLVRMLGVSPEKLQSWTRPGRFVSGPELVAEGLAKMLDFFGGDVWHQIQASGRCEPADALGTAAPQPQ